jgi:MFS family permease
MPTAVQQRNLLFVILDGVAIGLMSAAASFVSVLVIRLGASALWVSLLSSVPATIRLVMTIPWSQYADRQRRPQWVLAFSRLAVHAVYPLVALVPFVFQQESAAKIVVIVWSLSALPGSLSNTMFTLVMGNAVPPERRAFLMSRRWMLMGVAKLISLPLIGLLIDRVAFPLGYQIAFFINAVFAFGAFFCATQLRVPERTPVQAARSGTWWSRIQDQVAEVAQQRPFLVFVSGRALLNLGLALVAALIPIYWVQHLKASDTWVGYFNAALSAATLVAYVPWTRLKRKYGTRWTLIPAVLGTAIYPALLALTRAPAAVLAVVAFQGLAGAGINLAFFDALLDTCPRDRQARFVAINTTAVSLMGVIGPPIGAALLNVLSIRWVLAIGSLVSLLGVTVFAFAGAGRKRSGKSMLRTISDRLRTFFSSVRQALHLRKRR